MIPEFEYLIAHGYCADWTIAEYGIKTTILKTVDGIVISSVSTCISPS